VSDLAPREPCPSSYTDRLRQRPCAPKGHVAHRLPAALPRAPGRARTMPQPVFLPYKVQEGHGAVGGEHARWVHHSSTALRLLLERRVCCPTGALAWVLSSHGGGGQGTQWVSAYREPLFPLFAPRLGAGQQQGDTHMIMPPAMLNSEPGWHGEETMCWPPVMGCGAFHPEVTGHVSSSGPGHRWPQPIITWWPSSALYEMSRWSWFSSRWAGSHHANFHHSWHIIWHQLVPRLEGCAGCYRRKESVGTRWVAEMFGLGIKADWGSLRTVG